MPFCATLRHNYKRTTIKEATDITDLDQWVWFLHTVKTLFETNKLKTDDLLFWGFILNHHCNVLRKPFIQIPYGVILSLDERNRKSHSSDVCMMIKVHQLGKKLNDKFTTRYIHPGMKNTVLETGTVPPYSGVSPTFTPDVNLSQAMSDHARSFEDTTQNLNLLNHS